MGEAIVCRRCEEWKDPSQFYRDADPLIVELMNFLRERGEKGAPALPDSRVVCRACFAIWLDEQWADEQKARGNTPWQ